MSSVPAKPGAAIPGLPVRSTGGLRAVAQSVGSKTTILALQAGTGILTARMLGPAGRGELAAMILWPLFVANVTTLGVPSSLIYHLRNRDCDRDYLIANAFAMALMMGVAAAGIAAIVLPWWLRQYPPQIIHSAQWFLLTVPVCSITLAGRAVLEAGHDFGASNAIQVLTPFATLTALLLMLSMHHLNPYTAAVCYIAACIPSLVLMTSRVIQTGVRVARLRIPVILQILHYGVRSYGIDVLGTLSLQVDQVLVVSLLSADAMGSYVVVLSLSRMLSVFQTSVVMVLFPKAAGHSADKVLTMTGNSARISGLVSLVCGAIVCLAGPGLLRVLYGAEYASAAAALRILVLEAILSGVTFVLAQAFMALNRPGVVTLLQGIGLSLSVPLMLWLIPRYGIYGAAIALLTSTCARLLLVCAGFRIFLKTTSPRIVPGWRDLQVLLGACFLLVRERAV